MLLELRPVRSLGVRGERVQVRRLRSRQVAVRRQARLLRPGHAVHEVGLAPGHRARLRLVRRNPTHRHRHLHFHPAQRNAHRQGIHQIITIQPTWNSRSRRSHSTSPVRIMTPSIDKQSRRRLTYKSNPALSLYYAQQPKGAAPDSVYAP